MKKWTETHSKLDRMQLLKDLCKNKHWPAEGDKTGKGEKATDFPQRFMQCLEFAKYAPVFGQDKNNEYCIVPWTDIPETETRTWQEIIGFNPMEGFTNLDLDGCYHLRIWSRTKRALRSFELPKDELDPTRSLPHNSVIKFRVPGDTDDDGSPKVPVEVILSSSLLVWLCFHGIPMPKGSSKAALIEKVTLAVLMKQKLDYERISLNSSINRQSYISWEQMVNVSDIRWDKTPESGLTFLREKAKLVDSSYINEKFGLGKNGVRERGWKRFNSGSLDTYSLRVGTAKMDGEDDRVIIIEIKCTPSVKSDVYGVCLVFRSDGTYLPNKSKCDCPNGWLFCSHSLALFLLVRLIQVKRDWTYDDLCAFMPQPIKSLQNIPLPASMVFKQGCPRKAAFTLGKKLAKELPGYSQKDVESKRDADEAEEVDAQKEVLTQKMDEDVKSIDICQLLDDFVTQSTDADEIDKRINGEVAEANQPASNGNGKKRKKRKKKQKNKKLTSNDIREYNESLVNGAVSDEVQVKDLLRHNRIQELVSNGMIGSDMALTPHLKFFEADRQRQLREKSQARAAVSLPDNCDVKYLEEFRKRCGK